MINIEMIKDMTNAFGPSGFEHDVTKVAAKYTSSYPVKKDYMQNFYVNFDAGTDKPVVMLDSHTDEVGFMVQAVLPNGLLKILPIGGWVPSNVPAHTFIIKNSKGEYHRAISTSKPPHFSSAAELSKPLDVYADIQLDLGVTDRSQVFDVFGIQVGDPVAPEVYFDYNEKTGVMFGKAFDNRLGCCCILEVMKRLENRTDLPVHVTGALASQEEVGMRGAKVTAQTVKPSFSITFEGTPADDLYFDSYTAQGALGKGAQIRHLDNGMISNPQFIAFARELCEKYNIKAQYAVRKGGSTNASSIHLANEGCPCLVIGVPSRFAHTHYGYAHIDDMEAAVELAVRVIENLTPEKIKEVFDV
ncbi:MAG: M20/M25/M40 family metallo-hydrolase [Oscillospiraceae bacterium]|nr:M20/M25/M40 family metallo-hydrolase [Oscillospiraceae bacterium]